ncbi:hypothetical protein [Kitasatospora aureofaciens]|uniref:hypothetical protein n=1 Tax=Kitasatospora aureofaciens TaxID=1894 RepID=UPI0036F477B1
MTTTAELAPTERACVLQAADVRQMQGVTVPIGVPAHEVRRGPLDGTRGAVDVSLGLPQHLVFAKGDITYEFDGYDGDRVAVYRYAPAKSPLHDRIMSGVQQAYWEAAQARKNEGTR